MKRNSEFLIELKGMVKSFPGVLANDRVDLDIRPGEIHALLGENGAGKSTLVKMMYGILQPDEGSIVYNGSEVVVVNISGRGDKDMEAYLEYYKTKIKGQQTK